MNAFELYLCMCQSNGDHRKRDITTVLVFRYALRVDRTMLLCRIRNTASDIMIASNVSWRSLKKTTEDTYIRQTLPPVVKAKI